MGIDIQKYKRAPQDNFELPRAQAECRIEWARGADSDPAVALKAQQLHGQSYVQYGYFDERGLDAEGRLVPELDGTREKPGATTVINYLLAVPKDKPITEATATLRMIDIGEGGVIDDIPTYKYFKDDLQDGVHERLHAIVDRYGPSSVREVSALATAAESSHMGSYELMRAIMQNSILKREQTGINELYVAALTDKSLRPVLEFAGYRASEIIGDAVSIFTDDPRSAKDLQVTPVLIDPCAVLDGIAEDIAATSNRDMKNALLMKLLFLTDGLNTQQMGFKAANTIDALSA